MTGPRHARGLLLLIKGDIKVINLIMADLKFCFSIDRGGTFTDIYCEVVSNDGKVVSKTLKLLSEDPSNYKDAPTERIRRCLERESGCTLTRSSPVPTN